MMIMRRVLAYFFERSVLSECFLFHFDRMLTLILYPLGIKSW